MQSREVFAIVALVTSLSFVVSGAADEPQREMSPEEQMMMENWQAYMTPGDPHARLAKQAGEWDYTTKIWLQPGAPADEAKGTAHLEMIMDGRYLVQNSTNPFMGMTFNGAGLTGYDNMKKVYQTTWVDNMGTGVLYSEGTCEGKLCTYYGETPDVMLGKYKRVKSVTRDVSDDEMVFEMYDKGPDGTEWMNMEIVYHRKK